jgi:hypothetical protein
VGAALVTALPQLMNAIPGWCVVVHTRVTLADFWIDA